MQNGSRPSILFVDDEQRILTSLRVIFRNDYDVQVANGGAEALDVIRRQPVDVIVSDQRMPGMTGIEVLRAARDIKPDAVRILLTGYSDLNAIIGSINEGEIFRFVSKPWTNEELRATMAKAVEASQIHYLPALDTPAPAAPALPALAAAVPKKAGVIRLDHDPLTREVIGKALAGEQPLHLAESMQNCVSLLEQHEIAVIVSEAVIAGEPVTGLLGTLKQHQPHLVSIVVTERADANQAIDLINHGQIYRFLLKPLREGICKASLHSALRHYELLLKNPAIKKRFVVEQVAAPAMVTSGLMARIRQLRSVFAS